MPDLTDPHDRFFQEIFGRPEQAADLLQHYLPPEVAAVLDPDPAALVLRPGSFVDAELRRHASDLVFEARLRDGGAAAVAPPRSTSSSSTRAGRSRWSRCSCCATWCGCGRAMCARGAGCYR